MTTATRQTTTEELLRMPDDGFRYELVRGDLRRMSPAGSEHGRVALCVAWRLAQFVEAHGFGATYAAETGFQIASDPDTVRAPDVAFVLQERVDEVGSVEGYWPGASDLAVEVVSPGDDFAEVEGKVFDWLDAGTRRVLVVNPRRHTVTVYRSRAAIHVVNEEESLDVGEVVPGWRVAVRELFQQRRQ